MMMSHPIALKRSRVQPDVPLLRLFSIYAISSPRDVVVDPDVAGAVQAAIAWLTTEHVKIIIVRSHLRNVNEDPALAPVLHGVDVMIAGGSDELLTNEGELLVPGDVRNPDRTIKKLFVCS